MTHQGEFDFVDFNKRVQEQRDREFAEAKTGRDALKVRLAEAEAKRAEFDDEIVGLKTQIDVIDKFLGTVIEEAPRDSGIKKTLETIASKIDNWNLEEVVDAVREYKPRVKESSVRSALARLVREGILSVGGEGKGKKVWSFSASVVQEPTAVPLAPVQPPETVVKTDDEILSELQARIATAVEKSMDGVDSKTLAWFVTDVGATNTHLSIVLERLVTAGIIEDASSQHEAGGHVIRRPAEPGSKEELKRVNVQGRMAFPGMEKPPHL